MVLEVLAMGQAQRSAGAVTLLKQQPQLLTCGSVKSVTSLPRCRCRSPAKSLMPTTAQRTFCCMCLPRSLLFGACSDRPVPKDDGSLQLRLEGTRLSLPPMVAYPIHPSKGISDIPNPLSLP